MSKTTFIALCFALLSTPLQAEEVELIGDRPDFTESNATIARGHLQVEGGVEVGGNGDDLELAVPKLLFRYGLLDSLELRLEIPDLTVALPKNSDADLGPGGLAAGVKWVRPVNNRSAAGFIAMVGSPVTKGDFKTDGLAASLNGVWGVDFTQRLSLGGNLRADIEGLGASEDTADTVVSFTASLALGYAFTERLGGFVETFDTVDLDGNFTPNADLGLTYLVTPTFQLDIYGGTDISAPTGAWFSGAGVIALF